MEFLELKRIQSNPQMCLDGKKLIKETWTWARSSSRGQESDGTLRGFLKDFLSEIMWCWAGRMLPVHGRIKTSAPSSSSASSLPSTDGLSAYRNKIPLVISLFFFIHSRYTRRQSRYFWFNLFFYQELSENSISIHLSTLVFVPISSATKFNSIHIFEWRNRINKAE